MAQFDVYANPNPATRELFPYLLDVQADLLDLLATRVVVPLAEADGFGKPLTHLNPVFTVMGIPVILSTAELAGVPLTSLGDKVGSLAGHREAIIAALDFLLTGI